MWPSGHLGTIADSVYKNRLKLRQSNKSMSLMSLWKWIKDGVTYEKRKDGSRGNILSYDEKYAVSIGNVY